MELDHKFNFTEYKTFMGRYADLRACLKVSRCSF